MRIGIDLLGSDTPPAELFPAILQIAEREAPHVTLVVFTTKAVKQELCAHTLPAGIEFVYVQDIISMADDPILSIRHKKNSSIVAGMRLLKRKRLDAFVSAGNTGALVASAALTMPKLPGIKRPALLAVLPTLREPLTVIDVGGNVSCKALHLVQFAQLGAAYHLCSRNASSARIGLLNIGAESKKGTKELREAYSQLQHVFDDGQHPQISFIGNVEARDVFNGSFDVLVTDGYSGNMLLKTSEGVSSFVFDYIRANGSEALKDSSEKVRSVFDHAEYPGAIVCGIEGIVIKCHGNASATSMYNGILGAIDLARKNLITLMRDLLI